MTDTRRYRVDKLTEDPDDDDPTWDANDWAYMVMNTLKDDVVCICATKKEAEHIAAVLEDEPVPD